VVHEIIFPSSIYSPPTNSDRVSYARSTPALHSVQKLISDCTSLNVFAITPCTGLQIHRSWMRWNRNLMELLIFNFLFLEHVSWSSKLIKQRRPFLRLGDGDARVCNSLRYDFSHLNLYLMPCMVSENWDFSHNLLFYGH
jgi:hypothetical protein